MSACRILIVEDDPLVSTHIESIIETTVEAQVVVSQSVEEAHAALAQPFDFAFLDVDVLDGTTYAFAATLLAAGIAFAFVSASKREQMPSDLRQAPFIPKPYADADIAEMVRTAVGRA